MSDMSPTAVETVPDDSLSGTRTVQLPRWAAERLAMLHDAWPTDTFVPIMVSPVEMHINLDDGSVMVHRFDDRQVVTANPDGTSSVSTDFHLVRP